MAKAVQIPILYNFNWHRVEREDNSEAVAELPISSPCRPLRFHIITAKVLNMLTCFVPGCQCPGKRNGPALMHASSRNH